MEPTTVGLIGFVILIILIFLRVPVSFAMAIVGFAGFAYLSNFSAALDMISVNFFSTFFSYSLATVPAFILMGMIAHHSGIGASLFNVADKFIGHLRGGLALAVQLASAMFGAVSGALTATVATMGSVAIPQMRKLNHNLPFCCASIAAGSSLGSLIPPSVILVVYGVATEQSIGKLLMAGVIPGIVHMTIYCITIYIVARFKPHYFPVKPKATWGERVDAVRGGGVLEAAIVFFLSIGGLFLGWFSPTEAASVGTFALLVVTLVGKKINFEKTKEALRETVKLAAMIFMLIAGATICARFLAVTRLPFELASMLSGLDVPPFVIIILIVLVGLILGMFIDAMPLILLLIPIVFPIVVGIGYDPIWFGIIIVVICSLGVMTPPVGINIFIVQGTTPDVKVEEIFSEVLPFVLADWAFVFVLLLFPQIATFLPNLMY